MLTKYIIESKEFVGDLIVLRDLNFIRTYTVDEFKEIFNIQKIIVKKHPKGFLFFPFREVIGLVVSKGVPQNPRISIVVGKYGVPHYILHDVDDIRDFYTIELSKNRSNTIVSNVSKGRKTRTTFWDYQNEKMFEDCDHDPIDDWAYGNPPEEYD